MDFPLAAFFLLYALFGILSIRSLCSSYLFRVGRHLGRLPVLVAARLVYGVEVPLVEEDEEDDVVPEARQAVHDGHGHDEGEQVVDERVDELVRHHPPGHVRHALQLPVLITGGGGVDRGDGGDGVERGSSRGSDDAGGGEHNQQKAGGAAWCEINENKMVWMLQRP